MNKEEKLKNILEELQYSVDYPRGCIPSMDGTDEEEMDNDICLEVDKCEILLDYIKQLQQELNEKNKIIEELKKYKNNWNKLKEILPTISKHFENQYQLFSANCCEHILGIMIELEKGSKE